MKREAQFVICVGNKGYPASLELRKIYQVIPDRAASRLHQLRVIDEAELNDATSFMALKSLETWGFVERGQAWRHLLDHGTAADSR